MLSPSSGIGTFRKGAALCIRFVRKGCTNRPFFHVVVSEKRKEQFSPPIEQLGSFDPIPNEYNEKLVSLNLERIRWWMGNGAVVSVPVERLLGLSGFLPVHPTTYMAAWRSREAAEKAAVAEESKEKPT